MPANGHSISVPARTLPISQMRSMSGCRRYAPGGFSDCRPHRLRDTFAVRRLLAGFQLEDVSRLLGHSSVKVTEAYYAKWVPSRKLRLERHLAESLVNTKGKAFGYRQSCVLASTNARFQADHSWLTGKYSDDRVIGETPQSGDFPYPVMLLQGGGTHMRASIDRSKASTRPTALDGTTGVDSMLHS